MGDFEDEKDIIGGVGDESDDDEDEEEEEVEVLKVKKEKKEKPEEESESENENETEDESDMDSEVDPEDEDVDTSSKYTGTKPDATVSKYMIDLEEEDEEDDEEEDDNYLQKIDESMKHNIISEYHHELKVHNNEEVEALSVVVRNETGVIIDPLHRTLPFLTKYETARVLGERAKQLNSGAKPFVEIDVSLIDGYLIALKEFEAKKIPFIIKRPMPNGGCEYWKLKDLEVVHP